MVVSVTRRSSDGALLQIAAHFIVHEHGRGGGQRRKHLRRVDQCHSSEVGLRSVVYDDDGKEPILTRIMIVIVKKKE